MQFWGRYRQSNFKCKVYPSSWENVKQIISLTFIFKTLPNWYCFFYSEMAIYIKSTGYLFKLVSVMGSTWKHEIKEISYLWTENTFLLAGISFFFYEKWVSTNFSDSFPHVEKKGINKIKWSAPYGIKDLFKNTFLLDEK